jgi:UDP-2,4-diacetamido-2,4,6-trideoxy-beta-L-altropyranose hydrolase
VYSKPLNLVFRADADARIGTGHIMRCLALAQACQGAGGRGVFVLSLEAPALEERLKAEGMEVVHISPRPGSVEDASQAALLADQLGAQWLVIDGYHFSDGYQKTIKEKGQALLCIDDNGHASHYSADVVLNQNILAREDLYPSREPSTRLLLGTRYVLLRKEFLNWRSWKRTIPDVAKRLLVTLGGADRDNVTLKVLRGLGRAEANGMKAVVVAGPSNPNLEELLSGVRDAGLSVRLEANTEDMPALMAWADIAVSSGGTTTLEMAFMGLPALLLLLAQNQEGAARALVERKAFLSLGYAGEVEEKDIATSVEALVADAQSRLNLSRNGSQLVDGLGPRRVLDALSEAGGAGG